MMIRTLRPLAGRALAIIVAVALVTAAATPLLALAARVAV
jgi:hypothetical protein